MVHDKINLQNSVDISAYYGAMKQAEMLNAIAHINYQIRQSWKLLVWRYRVLGSMGLTDVPAPWRNPIRGPEDIKHILPVKNRPDPDRPQNFNEAINGGPYFFCVGHKWWGGFISQPGVYTLDDLEDDLLCANMDGEPIRALPVPGIIDLNLGFLTTVLGRVAGSIEGMNRAINEKCDKYGFSSWFLGAMSFAHFYQDQSDRKRMIKALTNKLIEGKDIDGGNIEKGVQKTFEKNLTFINQKSQNSLTHFSSLAGENHNSSRKQVQDLLKDNHFVTNGLYSRFEVPTSNSGSTDGGGCKKEIKPISTRHSKADPADTLIKFILDTINGYNDSWPDGGSAYRPSAGLEKTNLIVYYGVKAELDYQKQIFLPFPLTLKAKAFAKPFGGRIGPPEGADSQLPRHQNSDDCLIDQLEFDEECAPNYSRYPGDSLGLRSKLVHYYWTKVVRDSDQVHKRIRNYIKPGRFPADRDPMVRNYDPSNPTIFAIDIPARKWEMAAVAPDLFDVTYFTILPYYQYHYFPKIVRLLKELGSTEYVRGDLGTYCDAQHDCQATDFKGTSLLQQVIPQDIGHELKSVWQYLRSPTHPGAESLLQDIVYKIKDLHQLLTGWNPPTGKDAVDKYIADDYANIDNTPFGKCHKWVHSPDVLDPERLSEPYMSQTKGKIANGCIYGGRTGYSVKMVSEKWLKPESRRRRSTDFPDW